MIIYIYIENIFKDIFYDEIEIDKDRSFCSFKKLSKYIQHLIIKLFDALDFKYIIIIQYVPLFIQFIYTMDKE